MLKPITMPQSGFADTTLRLVAWLAEPGTAVRRGDPIAEIETEKATVELEALDEGTFTGGAVELGAELPAGAVIGWLAADA